MGTWFSRTLDHLTLGLMSGRSILRAACRMNEMCMRAALRLVRCGGMSRGYY